MQGNITRIFFPSGIQNVLYPRCFSSFLVNQKSLIHNQKFFEKHNIPPKPKKPMPPYFRFIEQVRPAIVKEFPNIKPAELVKVAAQRWRVVDSKLKEKLTNQYAEDSINYNKLKTLYEQNLTLEQKKLIKDALINEYELKEGKKIRKKSRELGKPKPPIGIFLRFLNKNLSERDKYPDMKEWMKAMSQEWKNVSADVKAKLEEERKCDAVKFNDELTLWEKRMIEEGNIDVVRKSSLLPQPKTKLKK